MPALERLALLQATDRAARGTHGRERRERDRVRQLTLRRRGVARAMTLAFANARARALRKRPCTAGDAFAARPRAPGGLAERTGCVPEGLISSLAYAAAVGFMEPFYVAAGFGLYLNRRVELEAWDIEQEFRRAFSAEVAAALLMLGCAAQARPRDAPPGRPGRTASPARRRIVS